MRRLAELSALLTLLAAMSVAAAGSAVAQTTEGEPTRVPEPSFDRTAVVPIVPVGQAPSETGDQPAPLVEAPEPDAVPDISISVESGDVALSRTVTIIILLTIGAIAPAILLLMTSFTRFAIVLGLTRNAIGVQSIPPAQVLLGLALFLTFFVMGPVFSAMNEKAVQPLLNGEMSQTEAIEAGFEPLREFMLAQTRDDDLRLFMSMSGQDKPETAEDVSAATLIPAFVISELRTAFVIGFIIFVPFLVIDLIVSAVLMSMGMVMLPPVFISLPLKLLLFVLVDGWALIVGSVVQSVTGVAA